MKQSAANPSLAFKFPDPQGKYREFRRLRAILSRPGPKDTACSLRFFAQFPNNRNRELFIDNRESQFPAPLSIRELLRNLGRLSLTRNGGSAQAGKLSWGYLNHDGLDGQLIVYRAAAGERRILLRSA